MGWCPNTGAFEGRQYSDIGKIELDTLDDIRGRNGDLRSEPKKNFFYYQYTKTRIWKYHCTDPEHNFCIFSR